MSVCTILVTYNRKQLLAEGLRAVLAQTHPVARVLVIDNASTDGTEEHLRESGLLDRPEVSYHRLPHNGGGAGGFSEGVRLGREHDCEWLWLMDDDSEPVPDALERLLAAPEAEDAATVSLAPKVEYASGGIDSNQRGEFRRRLRPLPDDAYADGEHREIGYMSFVGSLIRTSAARAIDPPRADFFVWGDDVEYSLRLRERGAIRLVPESTILHKRAAHAQETPRSRFVNRLLPVHFYPTPLDRFWQNLCGLRNYIWMKRRYEGQGPLSAAGTTLQFVAKHVLVDDRPLYRVRWILRFARDGRRGRFANIPPAEWAAIVRLARRGPRG